MKNGNILLKLAVVLTLVGLTACKSRRPDISGLMPAVEIQRLDRDIFRYSGAELSQKYGDFFDRYTEQILEIGKYGDEDFDRNLEMFRADSLVRIADSMVKAQYPNLDELTAQLNLALAYYRYWFPDKALPQLRTYIAGFCHSLIMTDSVLAIGLDKYLGDDCRIYAELGFYKYMCLNMTGKKILSDCVLAWITGEWFFDARKHNSLLFRMIYEGKILYAAINMLPDEPEFRIFGFTPEQMKWCENNEKNMWIHLVENKLLFSSNPLTIKKLIDIAPYTSEFTTESPGKACCWIGYKIVARYMKNSPTTTLAELMNIDDYEQIYRIAKYQP
ncbi:MAG: hypothetical protein LBD59_11105 [Prevotellaceae bacterium]|jgi:hypothetical protein|nr:hypothetical protein [Prevotellaceae bacterium]